MIEYRLRITVREDLVVGFVKFMNEKHIPDLLATGCFLKHAFEREGSNTFQANYYLSNMSDFERYESEFAQELKEDFLGHFPGGIEIEREVRG